MATGQQQGWTKRFKQVLNSVGWRSLHLQPCYRRLSLQSSFAGNWWMIGRWAIGGWAIVSLVATAGQAQQVVPLPPPPTVAVPGLTPNSSFNNSTSLPGGETVFLAPANRQGAASQYIVYVNGDSPYLLQQVRSIDPSASVQRYQGQAIIQAGTFDNEASARRQVAALNAQGIMAEMTMGNTEMSVIASNSVTTSHYLVIVPGSREELPALADRAIRMGIRQEAIQEKSAPLGPHLEIGPFAQHGDAKKISQFLNGGGFDSRVYYSR